jgi:hypothetical protein
VTLKATLFKDGQNFGVEEGGVFGVGENAEGGQKEE